MNDQVVEGRLRGSYQDTWANDGFAEAITERSTTGQPDTRYDQLEHIWQFGIASRRPVIVFHAIAWSPASTDADTIVFEYSADRVNWTQMFTVDATSQTSASQDYVLPSSLGGSYVFIRVRDTNHTPPSWKANDTVYVDYMVIRAAGE